MNLEHLDPWIGKTEVFEDHIAPFPANALAATLDRDDPVYVDQSPLPPLWHWLHFLPIFNLAEAGPDGHAALGEFLPPVPLPRRMWAGSRLNFLAPMRIGRTLQKVSTVKSITTKIGQTGPLVFVTVSHQVFDGEALGIEEEHDIVYREEHRAGAQMPAAWSAPRPAPEQSTFSREIVPTPVMLFRYSALTFNGHRIHYDRPFCTKEGYGGLVVHGPLLATFLLDLLRREMPGAIVKSFEFRAMSTVTDNQSFSLHGTPNGDGTTIRLWVRRADGALAMQATAMIA